MNEIDPIRRTDVRAMNDRARIMAIQRECQALPDGHRMDESPPLKHWLAPGIYCREIHLPADSLVVGRIHRHRHMNIITQGRVTVFTEFGLEEITAPAMFISDAGTKRVVHTIEDAVWVTIHPNPDNETDFDKLEERYTSADYAELDLPVGVFVEELQ
jgi:hypothetical protein